MNLYFRGAVLAVLCASTDAFPTGSYRGSTQRCASPTGTSDQPQCTTIMAAAGGGFGQSYMVNTQPVASASTATGTGTTATTREAPTRPARVAPWTPKPVAPPVAAAEPVAAEPVAAEPAVNVADYWASFTLPEVEDTSGPPPYVRAPIKVVEDLDVIEELTRRMNIQINGIPEHERNAVQMPAVAIGKSYIDAISKATNPEVQTANAAFLEAITNKAAPISTTRSNEVASTAVDTEPKDDKAPATPSKAHVVAADPKLEVVAVEELVVEEEEEVKPVAEVLSEATTPLVDDVAVGVTEAAAEPVVEPPVVAKVVEPVPVVAEPEEVKPVVVVVAETPPVVVEPVVEPVAEKQEEVIAKKETANKPVLVPTSSSEASKPRERKLPDAAPAVARRPPMSPEDRIKSRRIQKIMDGAVKKSRSRRMGASTFASFKRAEDNWSRLHTDQPFTYDSSLQNEVQNGFLPPQSFVTDDIHQGSARSWTKLREQQATGLDYDAVVCGGNLGIFFATALAICGHKVCIVEGGDLKSPAEEWNISMDELEELIRIGVLTTEDVEASVTTEFPSSRNSNKEVTPFWNGFFNYPGEAILGVSSKILLDRVKQRFLKLGGEVKESSRLQGIVVSENVGSGLDLGANTEPITARLVLDCMGSASPISRQQRYGKKPDGVCAVVGSVAGGYDTTGNAVRDVMSTNGEINDQSKYGQLQYFWEASAAVKESGGSTDSKTTYTFTYFDADEPRPSLTTLMDNYLETLPSYQNSITNAEDDLDFENLHFSYFPTYKDSPLTPEWSRILAVGDSSGIQSPLNFGQSGSLTKQLGRITGAVSDALEKDELRQESLSDINALQPNLSAAWMFQKAMSIQMGSNLDPQFVSNLLSSNFGMMQDQGQPAKKMTNDGPQFDDLISSFSGSFTQDPSFMPYVAKRVGIKSLAQLVIHVTMMGIYKVLQAIFSPFISGLFSNDSSVVSEIATFVQGVFSPIVTPIVSTFKKVRQGFLRRRRNRMCGEGSDFELPLRPMLH